MESTESLWISEGNQFNVSQIQLWFVYTHLSAAIYMLFKAISLADSPSMSIKARAAPKSNESKLKYNIE